MRSPLLTLSLILLITTGCRFHFDGFSSIPGSGTTISEAREVGDFQRIRLGGAGLVKVVHGDEIGLTVTCDDNLMEYIETEVEGGTLQLRTTENIRPTKEFTFEITCPELEEMKLGGSGSAELNGVQGQSLAVHISGSGSAKVNEYHGDSLDVRISGSGGARVTDYQGTTLKAKISGSGGVKGSGTVDTLEARVTGSGGVSFAEMKAKHVTASISGSGGLTVFASESFDGSISGSGSIVCHGQPSNRQTSDSGSGSIRIVD